MSQLSNAGGKKGRTKQKKFQGCFFFFFSNFHHTSRTDYPFSPPSSLDPKMQPLRAHLSPQCDVRSCRLRLYLYGHPKYAKSFPSLISGVWPGDLMIKTRLYLPNTEARKINCSYTYSAQEGSTETHIHTPVSAASRKVDFSRGNYFAWIYLLLLPAWRHFFHRSHLVLSLNPFYLTVSNDTSDCGCRKMV